MKKVVKHQNLKQSLTRWLNLSSTISTLFLLLSIIRQYAPAGLRRYFSSYFHRWFDVFSPYVQLSIDEFPPVNLTRDDTFACIHAYLGANSSKDAKRLCMSSSNLTEKRVLCVDESEEVTDKFNGATVWWVLKISAPAPETSLSSRCYKLIFHKKHRNLVTGQYLDHVINEGTRIRQMNRPRRLYLNSIKATRYNPAEGGWTYVAFDHPASFDSMAMDPEKKRELVDDLLKFSKSKEFYSRIGKAWKRGYLLYGPPGTGKSTLVAAMAKLLEYDVYDLELTAVKGNTELKKLLINTSSRSIIVIEDIDCSIDLTRKRGEKTETGISTSPDGKQKLESSFTLSGLLNFIDGIWSSCGGERIIVFTTNYVKSLDPALIRTGRMDKHIELSYCGFEGFKVLAKNYLLVEAHPKFDVIKPLLEETDMTPADVAEHLMPKFFNEDPERCLDNLIRALEKAKADALERELIKKKKKAEDLQKVEEAEEEPAGETTENLQKAEEAMKEAGEEKTEEVKAKGPVAEVVNEENVEKKQVLSQANGTSTT